METKAVRLEESRHPILDAGVLLMLEETVAAGIPEVMVDLFDSYLNDAPRLLQNLRNAAESGDMPAVQFASHTLKSGSATLGAMRLADLCRQLEEQAKAGRRDEISALIQAAHEEFGRVGQALQAEKQARIS